MKNAEKFREIFKEFATEVWAFPEKDFSTWLNAEYEEPTTKNNLGVDCISREKALGVIRNLYPSMPRVDFSGSSRKWVDKYKPYIECEDAIEDLPSVTPQLSVPEVTALAEWTEKLTKASEDAYNKGYADGMKAPQPRKGHWINTANPCMSDNIVCSECGYNSIADYKFCPNCGAKMESEET